MEQAARNNAAWCDAVCRAHGRPGEFLYRIWINCNETPPFYPNAVTLSARGTAAQRERIDELVRAGIAGEWGVKDSFCTLDLAPLGFRVLFEAQWIWRPALLAEPDGRIAEVRWSKVDNPSDLAAWEAAWSGDPSNQVQAKQEPIFRRALLDDEDICVIAARHSGRIVAGAVANRAAGVVGLSNVFVPARDGERFRAGCVAAAIDAFPGLPIVGYERGPAASEAGALGFETFGPLRIWVRKAES
jgi:hypothetical protein